MRRWVFFDGLCNLCHGTVQVLIRWDRNRILRYGSLQEASAKRVLDSSQWRGELNTVVYVRGDRVYRKSTAFLEIMSDISAAPLLWRCLFVFPVGLRDWFYDRIAKNRYAIFGKKEECPIPTKNQRELFLD